MLTLHCKILLRSAQIRIDAQNFGLTPEKTTKKTPQYRVRLSLSELTAGETRLTGSRWDGVNVLHSSQYDAVFWFCG